MENSSKQYDETNRGVLFSIKEDWSLIQQGKLNINGDQLRVIGVKRLNKDGQEIVELYRAMGTLKKADQNSEKDPYAKGVVNALVDKGAMIISGWKEKSERGNSYISLRLREFANDTTNTQVSSNQQLEKKVTRYESDDNYDDNVDW
tara:strand:- start:4285 stop:4725 length:441 start_codon:yes stop_codon:yes gene_type:complete